MNIVKLLLVLALAGFAYQYWGKYRDEAAVSAAQSRNGFVALPKADGLGGKEVVVFAAENCPEEAARRADGLVDDLARKGIPVTRSHHASFTLNGASSDEAQRVMAVMNGELPVVMVRGKAKANPTLAEVVAEFHAQGSK